MLRGFIQEIPEEKVESSMGQSHVSHWAEKVRLLLPCGKRKTVRSCVANLSVGFGIKEFRPIFRAGETPKIPFLCVSSLQNPAETLAKQTTLSATG